MPEDSASPPQQRLAYLEDLVDALGGVVWEFDWSTGCFTYVSGAAERLLGYTASEWTAPGFWLERLHPDDAEWAPSYCVAATKDGRDHEFEYRMIHKDGRAVWVYDLVSVDPEARMEGRLRGILLDITERKTAQAQAASRDEELQAVFRVMQDAYFRVAPDDRVTSCEAPQGMLMLRAGETATGQNLIDLFAPRLEDTLRSCLAIARDTDTMVVSEFDVVDGRGSRAYEARFLPLTGGEVSLIVRDITDKRDVMGRLERSRERYRTLIDMSPYAVIVATLDHRIVFSNAAAEAMLEVGAGGLAGRNLDEFIDEARASEKAMLEAHRVEAQLRVWNPGEPAPASPPVQSAMRTLTGRGIDVERSVAGVMFRDKPSLLIQARDVTDELEAQRLTRESEARFRALIDATPIGIHLYEERAGRLVFMGVNPAADQMLGLNHAELIGHALEDAFPGLRGTEVPEAYRRVALAGEDFRVDEFEYDDNEVAGTYEVNAFQTGPGSMAVAFTDITERTLAQNAIADSERKLTEAQALARVGHYDFDMVGDRWSSSATLDEIFGIDADYVRDLSGWVGLVHPDDRDSMATYVAEQVIREGAPFDREYRVQRASDGETRWVHGLGQVERDAAGAPVRLFGTIQDMTERMLAEERERRYAERLSTMAADLTITEDRERRRLAEELHDRVGQTLAAAAIHLRAAREDPSGCSSASAGDLAVLLERAIGEVRAITTELAPSILYELGLGPALQWQCDDLEKLHHLRVHLRADVDESGVTDDAKMVLFRAARELLVNVWKHAGVPEAWMSLDELPGWLQLTVLDNGCGCDPDKVTGSGESGFGLFSIRDRLPHLGGEFEIESAVGKGTCVTLRVPRTSG